MFSSLTVKKSFTFAVLVENQLDTVSGIVEISESSHPDNAKAETRTNISFFFIIFPP